MPTSRTAVFHRFWPVLMLPFIAMLVLLAVVLPSAHETVHRLVPIPAFPTSAGGGTAEMALLRSPQTLARVVDDLHLTIRSTPRYFPIIGAILAKTGLAHALPTLSSRLSRYAWGGERWTIDMLEVPPQYLGQELTLVAGETGSYRLTVDQKTIVTGRVGEVVQCSLESGRWSIAVSALTARPGTEFILVRIARDQAIERLQRAVAVSEKLRHPGMLAVTLHGDEDFPPIAANTNQIMHAVVAEYRRQRHERHVAAIAAQREAQAKQMALREAQLETALLDLERFRVENEMENPVEKAQQLRARLSTLSDQLRLIDQKHEEAVRRFGPTHPAIAALDAKRGQLLKEKDAIQQQIASLPERWKGPIHEISEAIGETLRTAVLGATLLSEIPE